MKEPDIVLLAVEAKCSNPALALFSKRLGHMQTSPSYRAAFSHYKYYGLSLSASSSVANIPQRTPTSAPTPSATPAARHKKKAPTGSSFTIPEDKVLTRAWVHILEDGIVGSDQKGEIFYKSINEYNSTIKLAYCPCRIDKLGERRIRKILAECLSFADCMAKINNARASGTLEEDFIHMASAFFNKLEISSVLDDCGPLFQFMSFCCILKDHPKLNVLLNQPNPPKRVTTSATKSANK